MAAKHLADRGQRQLRNERDGFWGLVAAEAALGVVDEFCLGIPDRPVILADKSGTAMIRKSFGGATV